MSEVKKIATRESYGNALVELGAEHYYISLSASKPQLLLAWQRCGR